MIHQNSIICENGGKKIHDKGLKKQPRVKPEAV